MHKIPVGILGASGYAGRELCQLVLAHPRLRLAFAAAHDQAGSVARFAGRDVSFISTEAAPLSEAALIFSALPHGVSGAMISAVTAAGSLAIDLSTDLRPGNGQNAVPYGLTELTRASIPGAPVVANPGCYPTAILLAVAPLFQRNLVAGKASIVINAASGVSGAGNSPKRELLFAELSEDFRAYAVGNQHRHLDEMRATLESWGSDAELIFTPHLLPVARGILASITVPLREPLADPLAPWRETYRHEPFVEVSVEPPTLRDVCRRNVARISACMLAGTRQPMLLVSSAIDNLIKGAAGQAIQNANLMLGLAETLGLPA